MIPGICRELTASLIVARDPRYTGDYCSKGRIDGCKTAGVTIGCYG